MIINYEEVGARMKARRLFLGLSLNEAGKRMGVTATTLKRWEDGYVKSIKTTKMLMIANALETTPEAFFGLEEKVLPINGIEPIPQMKSVPILGEIACGDPKLAEQNFDGMANIPNGIEADFVVRAKGDSMINARIYDGDLVFIKRQSEVDNGEIAAVLIENEVTLKRVYKYPNRLELRPENPMYSPINVEGNDLLGVRILGKPVAFVGMIW